MNGPSDWSSPADYIDDPDSDRPLLVPSPVAAERRDGRSLTAQDRINQTLRGER